MEPLELDLGNVIKRRVANSREVRAGGVELIQLFKLEQEQGARNMCSAHH